MTSCLLCLCLSASIGQEPVEAAPLPAPIIHDEIIPITICDFARAFKPQCGSYEVVFLHPVKCCPVTVCFDLPNGCPTVRVGKRSIVFDYGKCGCVTINFRILCGRVSVHYS